MNIHRLIIAGPRNVEDVDLIRQAIKFFGIEMNEIIEGGCRTGIDSTARYYAKQEGIPNTTMHANWKRYRRSAGPIRNRDMAIEGDAALCIWNGKSKGTASMIKAAVSEGIPAFVWPVKCNPVAILEGLGDAGIDDPPPRGGGSIRA